MLMQKHITRRDAVIGSAVGTLSLAGCAASQEPKENEASGSDAVPLRLAIIHTNDTHGYDIKSDESLGMAAVAQLRHDWEEQGYEVLVLDAGDAVQGNVLVGRSKGATAMDFMDAVGYDAMALGNHEFDFGQDAIEGFVQAATFPVLSANTFVEATGERLVEANTILVLSDGTKVGVFGLTTPTTPTSAFPLLVQGLRFLEGEELYACAQEQADNLRAAGCSLVVCLAHLGEDEADAPNRAQDVATHVSGIDLIIDGHDHAEECQTLTNAAGESVLVVEAGCYTHAVGVVTWEDGKLTSTLERSGPMMGRTPRSPPSSSRSRTTWTRGWARSSRRLRSSSTAGGTRACAPARRTSATSWPTPCSGRRASRPTTPPTP